MSEPRVKTWLDIAPAYLDFAIKFLRNPRTAFESLELDGRVSSDLTGILLGGVALSYVFVLAVGTPGLAQDQGNVAKWIRELAARDGLLLPAVAMLATLFLGIAAHLAGRLSSMLTRGRVGLPGCMEDSVNATLGFAAVFVPLVAGVVCCATRLPAGVAIPVGVGLSVGLGVFPLVYFPWSLSSIRSDASWGSTASSLATIVVAIYVVALLLT
jgi:hypothetical protein